MALVAGQEHQNVVSCRAYGVCIELRANVDVLEYVPSLVPGAKMERSIAKPTVVFGFNQTDSAFGQRLFTVDENGVPFFSSADVHAAVRALESHVHRQLATHTEEVVFVHAGVVAWRGKAIVIPGPSQSGKSTLVAALVAGGATYYSDEYAVVDFEGRIHAFPRQLRLRPDMLRNSGLSSAAHSAQGNELLCPLQLGWVLDVQHCPGAVWNPRILTPGQTLLTLLANTVAVRRQSELTVKALGLAVSPAVGLRCERRDAESAARDIIRLIDGTGRQKVRLERNRNEMPMYTTKWSFFRETGL